MSANRLRLIVPKRPHLVYEFQLPENSGHGGPGIIHCALQDYCVMK
jgi:hypothetical protein